MLYERWREISRAHARETALIEAGGGGRWTFSELAREVESLDGPAGNAVYARGRSADFVKQTLLAWREAKVLCPLEPGQAAPEGPPPPAGCAHLKLTSATSGAPKMIAFRAEQLFADAANIVSTMGLRPEWPNLAAISLAHSYGFSNLVLPLLLFGIPLVLARAALPETVLEAAGRVPEATVPAVPALWKAWHEAGAIPPGTRLAISAGAPLPQALEAAVFERGLKIHNFYGSSECGGIAYDRTERPREEAACAGSAMENVRLSVGGDGRLIVESEAAGEGYWPASSPDLGNGRFVTNDLAELAEGMVLLRGRAGDVINVAGRKVSPESIESALRGHPGVRECVVFGVPAPEGRSERIVVCVSARENSGAAALHTFLSERLPPWQLPRDWWFTDALAANARGKISRADWRRRYLETHGEGGVKTM